LKVNRNGREEKFEEEFAYLAIHAEKDTNFNLIFKTKVNEHNKTTKTVDDSLRKRVTDCKRELR